MNEEKKTTCIVDLVKEKTGEKDKTTLFEDCLLDKKNKIYIGVSGGSDSMFLLYCLMDYCKKNQISFDRFTVLHFNHNTKHGNKAEEKLRIILTGLVCVYGKAKKKGKNEEEMRKQRKVFFNKTIKKQSKNCKNYLLLGHNLSDRIETTYMNMERGAKIGGILSIRKEKLRDNYVIRRPLIEIMKNKILTECKTFGIPYIEDISNKDILNNYRNMIRHGILEGKKNIGEWKKIYKLLEIIEKKKVTLCQPLKIERECFGIKIAYYIVNKSIDIHRQLYTLGLYGVSEKFVFELELLFKKKKGGTKYYKGWNFVVSQNNLYLLKGERKFRNNEEIKEQTINKSDFIALKNKNKSLMNVVRNKKTKVRSRKPGDKIKGKSIKKQFITNKIPVFLRSTTPIVLQNGIIVGFSQK